MNTRLPRRRTTAKKAWQQENDGQEVRMGSAKFKKKTNDPSFIIPDDTSQNLPNILEADGD